MKIQAKYISQVTRQLTTNLKRIASLTLKLPVLAMVLVISLPAVLYGQASLSLAQPPTTVVAVGSPALGKWQRTQQETSTYPITTEG